MDMVELDEMGLDSSSEFIHGLNDSSIIYTSDGPINIACSDDLGAYDNKVTYVTLPNLVQIVQDGSTQNVGYLINNSQVSAVSQPSIIVNQGAFVEISETASHLKADTEDINSLQKQLSDFLKSPTILVASDISKDSSNTSTRNSHCPEKALLVNDKHDVDPPDNTGKMQCEKCNVQFSSWKLYRKHKWKHLHEKPFQCTFCQESFNYELNLNLHLAIHNPSSSGNPTCPVCKKSFNRVASLKAHIMLHEREETLFCNECGEEFASPLYLTRHMAEHRAEKYNQKVDIEKKTYRCKLCGQVFETAASCKFHRMKHHRILHNKKIKKFSKRAPINICDYCQKSFDKPSQLLRHKRIHTGERPYKCEICGRAFNQKGSLQIHMLKHTREKPYVCQFCNGTFSQKGNLQAHVNRLHVEPEGDEKVFKCDKCTCIFRKIGSLNAHCRKWHSNSNNENFITPSKGTSLDTSNKENENTRKVVGKESAASAFVEGEGAPELGECNSSGKAGSCPHCRKEFTQAEDLVRHIQTHTQDKPFKCYVCDKTFSLVSGLSLHMKVHNEQKKYACSLCKKSYSSIRNWKLHKKKHTAGDDKNIENGQCSPGNADANSSSDKPVHISESLVCLDQVDMSSLDAPTNIILTEGGNIVDMSNAVEEDDNIPSSYRCLECNMVFKKQAHLTLHLQIHNTASFTCEQCPCAFTSRNTLNLHVKQHHTAMKHACKFCDIHFSSESSLRQHEVTHVAEFLWACPICGVTFKSHSSGKKHLSIKHPIESKTTLPVRVTEKKKENAVVAPPEIKNSTSLPIVVLNEETDIQTKLISLHPSSQLFLIASKTVPETKQLEEYPVFQEGDLVVETPQGNHSQKLTYENSIGPCIFTFQGADAGNAVITRDISSISTQPLQNDSCEMAGLVLPAIADFSGGKAPHAHLPENPHTCITCSKSFSSAIEYEEHLKLHKRPLIKDHVKTLVNNIKSTSNKQRTSLSCSICNMNFLTLEDFTQHQESHINPQRNENMTRVYKSLIPSEELQNQNFDTTIEETIRCYTCHAEFLTEKEYESHCSKFHPTQTSKMEKKKSKNWRPPARRLTDEEVEVLSTIEPDNPSEKVLLQSLLEKERFEHPVKEDPKPPKVHRHKCKYCPKSFRKPSDLIRHMRTHTGEKPYKCPSCNKWFSIKSAAASHMKTHTKDKSYECYICSKLFASTGSLKIHMRLHTGLKPFACHLCDATFRTSGHKKAHVMSHLKANLEDSDKGDRNSKAKPSENCVMSVSDLMRVDPNELGLSSSSMVVDPHEIVNSPHEIVSSPHDIVSSSHEIVSSPHQSSDYLIPMKNGVFRLNEKNEELLMSFKLTDQEEDKGNQSKSPKFLVNIDDEGGGNGATPRYFLSIKDGEPGEDGFVLESISDDQIIVTITKGDTDISKLSNQPESVCIDNFERKSDLDVDSLGDELVQQCQCPECGESFSLGELRTHKCIKSVSLDLSLEQDLFLFS